MKDPAPEVSFESMGDFALNYKLKVWVKSFSERYSTSVDLTKALYINLNKARINIPFPTQTVHVKR